MKDKSMTGRISLSFWNMKKTAYVDFLWDFVDVEVTIPCSNHALMNGIKKGIKLEMIWLLLELQPLSRAEYLTSNGLREVVWP